MKSQFLCLSLVGIALVLLFVACTPETATPTIDVAGTIAVQLASEMLTQTVAAYSPTSPPSPTPLPATETPLPTDTATPKKVADDDPFIGIVHVSGEPDPPCTSGPGSSYQMQSYIHAPKDVGLLGVGHVPGWYVISNPYFGAPCWLPAENVEIVELDLGYDESNLPVIYP